VEVTGKDKRYMALSNYIGVRLFHSSFVLRGVGGIGVLSVFFVEGELSRIFPPASFCREQPRWKIFVVKSSKEEEWKRTAYNVFLRIFMPAPHPSLFLFSCVTGGTNHWKCKLEHRQAMKMTNSTMMWTTRIHTNEIPRNSALTLMLRTFTSTSNPKYNSNFEQHLSPTNFCTRRWDRLIKAEELDKFITFVGELVERNPETGVFTFVICVSNNALIIVIIFHHADKKLKSAINELRRKYRLSPRKSQLLYIYNLMCEEGTIEREKTPLLRYQDWVYILPWFFAVL
jgi:hypothetical protein